jgi:2-polyprenyl-6-methoxyphenol hydroxylase-like FAD-dependent oxidoreductase
MPQQELDTVHCADALIERGIKVHEMNYYDRSDTLLMGADFTGLVGKTAFPFYLLLPQNITEDTLRKKLKEVGIPLFRPYKVVGMRENPNDGHAVDVSFENGQSITAQYVIGADGSQSAVRPMIPFWYQPNANCQL